MLKKLLLITIILSVFTKVKAQENFIFYNNDTEKLLFKGVTNADDCLKLIMASDLNEADTRKYYGNLVNDVKQIGIELDKIPQAEKKVAKLQQVLHTSYLKNFSPIATFSNVFSTGNYNAPQATLLYAWFLDQYHIPYEVHEGPNKLFILAYPLTTKIVLEGIDNTVYPGPDNEQKLKYVLDLIKLKYIDEDYLKQLGATRAFDEFFYAKGNLNVKTLAGYAYFNRAELQVELNKGGEAYSDALKANILSGQKKCKVLQDGVLLQLIPGLKFRTLADWEAVVYALNNIPIPDDQKKYFNYEFEEASQDLLFKRSMPDLIERIHSYVNANLKDTTLRNTMDEEYYTEAGRFYYTTYKFPEALQNLSKVLTKNPNNAAVKSVVVDIVMRKMMSQNTASVHNLTVLDQAIKDFPFFAEDITVQRMYLYNYASLAGTAFSRADKEDGEKYLKLMCAKLQSNKPDPQLDIEQIGIPFVRESEFYFNKQNKQKALQVLNEGLKYAPHSIYITQRITYLKNMQPAVKQSSAYDKLKIFNQ